MKRDTRKLRFSDEVLGFVPARGGSKSVPYKNLAPLGGWPLMRWVIEAGKEAPSIGRVVCSTDDDRIAATATDCGAEVIKRPPELAADDSPTIDSVIHVLDTLNEREGVMPWAVALLQPTSPFVLPGHVEDSVAKLKSNKRLGSVQTVTKPPHNHHAFNQRIIDDEGVVRFRFLQQRKAAYNKQRKPSLYVFGNLATVRSSTLLRTYNVFPPLSYGIEIPATYAIDVDAGDDFALAEWYLETERVSLPFWSKP